MASELKSGEKTINELVMVTFDTPKAKDDFLRKLAAAGSKDVADLLIGKTDGKAN